MSRATDIKIHKHGSTNCVSKAQLKAAQKTIETGFACNPCSVSASFTFSDKYINFRGNSANYIRSTRRIKASKRLRLIDKCSVIYHSLPIEGEFKLRSQLISVNDLTVLLIWKWYKVPPTTIVKKSEPFG